MDNTWCYDLSSVLKQRVNTLLISGHCDFVPNTARAAKISVTKFLTAKATQNGVFKNKMLYFQNAVFNDKNSFLNGILSFKVPF